MPRITIADVAREAGVSMQTVSRALNNKGEISPETRQAILAVVDRLGYRPSSIARSLATNRTSTLGLVVPDIANPFFPQIARGADDAARAQGYQLFLCNTDEDPDQEEAVLRALEDQRVDGVIVCSARLPDDKLLLLLGAHQQAVVVNRPVPPELAGMVLVDDFSGAAQAVSHLLAYGRTHVGLLAGPSNSHSARRRVEGYRATLDRAGISPDAGAILPCPPTLEGGFGAARALLRERPDTDALFCYNDLVAVGALRACVDLGLAVPERIAIVGCDDILPARLVSPPLTTLRVSKYDIGLLAVRMLLRRVSGELEDGPATIKPELIVRASAPGVERVT